MRIIVYTAIVGNVRDKLRPPRVISPDVRFICFSDREKPVGPWEVLPPVRDCSTTRRTARYHKIIPDFVLPDHDVSVWIDGCLELRVDTRSIVAAATATGHDVAAFKHPRRSCAYREHEACRRLKKDDPVVMAKQMEHYQFVGYPMNNGLAETSCVVRKNTSEVRIFNYRWWDQVLAHSHRDQLSFDYAMWSLSASYGHLQGCRDKSPYFVYHPHVGRPRKR